jgi:2-polyprenyl-3-methyl-5-hydroxy-6-metoxy-1,4-benzoquinol methylase
MNARGKTVDKTFLSLDTAETRGFIHRDYIAHCFRWTHAAKHIQSRWKEARILDVGCGKEMPLPKLIYSSRMRPLQYVGVDVEETPIPEMLVKATFPCEKLIGDIAEVESYEDLGFDAPPNFITCFEVLEHVEFNHAIRCLEAIRAIAAPDALFMVSTPCYNLKDVADNHVNEMTYTVFGSMLEKTGWFIDNHFGTFASLKDYTTLMGDEYGEMGSRILNRLRTYYDSNVLSTIFAPLFPQASRNCIWDCAPKTGPQRFPKLENIPHPWGSSEEKAA